MTTILSDCSPPTGKEGLSACSARMPRWKWRFVLLWRRISNTPAAVFILLMVFSVPPRLVNLNGPLTGEHEFRQTQTGLSVWEIREHGFSLLHPKLPLFGPPWECPLEYPVFQSVAAALDWVAPWSNLDLSIRLTNLAFFYLTALALYLLGRQVFKGAGMALFSVAVFLFSPYNVFWSRTGMIEYAATFFALAYLVTLIRWTERPSRMRFAFCLLFGVLGCLTKITTFALVLPVSAILAGWQVWQFARARHRKETTVGPSPVRAAPATVGASLGPWQLCLLGSLLVLPVLTGWWYTRYGDNIKEQSPYTAWLSTSRPYMRSWLYGTRAQRLNLNKWEVIARRACGVVTPSLSIALVVGFVFLPFQICGFDRWRGGNFCVGCGLVLAPAAVAFSFFNLYWIHTYYLIACSPLLALTAGTGLSLVFDRLRKDFLRLLFVLLLVGCWAGALSAQAGRALYASGADSRISYLTAASRLIGKNEPVIILSASEWSPFAPYYLKRRAFMAVFLNKPVDLQPLFQGDYFKRNGFHWLLVENTDPVIAKLAALIISQRKSASQIAVAVPGTAYTLYALSDQ